jgi:hypothetical protein
LYMPMFWFQSFLLEVAVVGELETLGGIISKAETAVKGPPRLVAGLDVFTRGMRLSYGS